MREVIFCECFSTEHQLILSTVEYDVEYLSKHSTEQQDEMKDEVFISFHLAKKGFLYRLKHGLRYILGYQSRYGAFDEIITTKTKIKEIARKL